MAHSLIAFCILAGILHTAQRDITAFERPDQEADIFGVILKGETVELLVRTSEGWLGFDPGTAQAGNTGSFRFRWIMPDSSIQETDSLEIAWGPEPGITYVMTYEDTPVYSFPDTASAIIASISGNSAAAVEDTLSGWIFADLKQSPFPRSILGWIRCEGVSLNGQ